MEKNKFITSIMILIGGGFVVKILGFIIKIMYTRAIGPDGIGLYNLVVPLISLIVTISGFAMPAAISKLVAEQKVRSMRILSQGIIFLLVLNFAIMIIVILGSGFISDLLNESKVRILIIGSVLAMPNMALACVLKGYFYGKQRMLPNSISNVIEQLIRICFIIFILPSLIKKSVLLGILCFILLSVITEGASIITFLFLLPKNVKVKISNIKYEKEIANDLIHISTNLVSTRIIGNIGYFFEPIILSNTLKWVGYSNDFFIKEYGIYNSYSLALLLMPSFLIQALCTALIPEISKYNAQKNKRMVKRRIDQSILIAFIIGILSSLFILIFRKDLLSIIYNTSSGANYIVYLASFFTLYYLEAPISSVLQALGYGKYCFKIALLGVIIKILVMFIASTFRIGLFGLVIAEGVDICIIVLLNSLKIRSIVKSN